MRRNPVSVPYNISLLLVLLFCGLVAACRQTPQPEPTPAPTAEPPAPGAWEEIQARGRLIVGTSADYPPFAFYTPDFELTGYDVALAEAIGEKLGLEVEIKDMAFDGLGGALEVDQIDAAVAAISVTDARRESVDFSNVYFVSEDAVLARAGEEIAVTDLADLAPYRVAVQSGTVFETWLQTDGVDAGILSPDNLLVYQDTEKAIEDLQAGLVDLVIADSPPLEIVAQNPAFAIVGRGLNRQRFAVALAKGSNLLPRVNDALTELQNEGVLADLANRYLSLNLTDLVPLPTPEPTPAVPEPTAEAVLPPAACVNAMAFVSDLNLDDQNMAAPPPVSPGTAFQKSWRIRNTGTCTWDRSYMLTFVDGNVPQARMGGMPTPISGTVAPGATYDMTIDLVAPLTPGVYQAFWTMRGPNGLLFGDRLWVGITVPTPATPTPEPTAPPSTSVSFTVDRSNIRAGECVTFAWAVQGASAVYFSAQGQPWQQNQVSPQGTRGECPPVTTIYDLRSVFFDGTVDVRSIRIDVVPAPNAPLINSFTVTPGFQITVGQCVDVRWQVSGEVTHIRVARNGTTLWDGAPLSGTSRDCPPVGQMAYSIVASGPGGTSQAQQNLTVLAQPTAPPQATATPRPTSTSPAPSQPVVYSFSVTPARISTGQCVSVVWSVGGNVSKVQITRNGVIVVDFANLSGNVSDCLNTPDIYTYRVEVTSPDGQVAFQQATVHVGSPTPTLVGSWRLTVLNGANIIPGTEITAIFGDAGNLSGSAGCNSYTGGYQISGDTLSIGGIGTGQQFCAEPPGVMDQEQLYITVLNGATGFSINGQQLSIRSSRGLLQFENLAEPR